MRQLKTCLWALIVGVVFANVPAYAAYPDRPIRIVVPFGAGSAPDIVARLLADHLSPRLGVALVVENTPGAGGTIGVNRVAKAAPDGYTLVLSGDAALVFPGAGAVAPPYAPLTDLAPVSQLVITPNVLVVSNSVAAKSVDELIAMVRARPGAFNCAHLGTGTSSQRACDLLSESAGLDLVQVPFTKSPLPDVVAGRVQIFFANIATAMPMVREGQLRALAVSSLTRSPVAPALPTLNEAGLPGFEAVAWFGLLAPAGTSELAVRRLQSETKHALEETAVNSRLIELGTLPVGSSPREFAALLRAETKRWSGLRPAGLPPPR